MKEINETVINTKIEEIATHAEKAADNLQTILNKLIDVEEKLRSILKQHGITDEKILKRFSYKGIEIRYAGSRLGRFIHLMVNGKLIPYKSKDIGGRFFYHGDCFADYDYVGIEEIERLVNNLEGFLENVKEVLTELQEIKVKDINI